MSGRLGTAAVDRVEVQAEHRVQQAAVVDGFVAAEGRRGDYASKVVDARAARPPSTTTPFLMVRRVSRRLPQGAR
ncbi:MAG: hypothetical protein JWR32_4308 [Mycobacterium sp.]|jgi:hypothetical protein|nr:hypothetical protein [Mycobacterium sp.]